MAVLGFFGDLFSNYLNRRNVQDTNASNIAMQRETNVLNKRIADEANALQLDMFNQQMDYTRQIQEQEWNRADTQLQRAVADAELAGLSPLTALGAGSTGQVVSQPSAPSLHASQMVSPYANPMNPVDFASLRDLDRAVLDIIKQDRQSSSTEKIEMYKQEQENSRFTQQLRQTSALTNKQLNLENSKESRRLQEQIREFNATLEVTKTENNRRYKLEELDTLKGYALSLTGGASGNYKKCDTYKEWEVDFNKWCSAYAEESASITADYISTSKSKGGSGSIDIGIPYNPAIPFTKGGISGSGQTSDSKSESFAEYYKHRMASFFANNPLPIYF